MPRHENWARFRTGIGTDQAAQAEGRNLLGGLMNRLKLGGVKVGSARQVLADGTVVIASYDGTTPIVTTVAPQVVVEEEGELDLWIPRGMVVVPAQNSAPQGWGLPAVTPAANPDNTRVANWTPNGALPQVLLSLLPDAGFPTDPNVSQVMYWDDFEAPDTDIIEDGEGATWSAFRIRFRVLGAAFDQVLAEINARRDPDQPLCGPFTGYADIAAEYSRIVSAFGIDEAAYPIGARTNFRRTEKEGTVKTNGTAAANGQLGAGVLPPGLGVGDIVDALVGVQPTLVDGTFDCGTSFSIVGAIPFFTALIDHNDQWVHCGNIDWLSIHDEIPRLSWLGSRGRSIPTWELATGVITTTTYDGTGFPPTIYVSNWLDATNANFQGATLEQFGHCIYARGRMLAQLPNNGYVLGAAIQRIEATDATPARYLLIAIAWHRADQKLTEVGSPSLDPNAPLGVYWDTSSDIRVWMAELPTRSGLACAPEYVVDGLFDAVTNPRGSNRPLLLARRLPRPRHRLRDRCGIRCAERVLADLHVQRQRDAGHVLALCGLQPATPRHARADLDRPCRARASDPLHRRRRWQQRRDRLGAAARRHLRPGQSLPVRVGLRRRCRGGCMVRPG